MASWMYAVESYGMPDLHSSRQLRADVRDLGAHALDDLERSSPSGSTQMPMNVAVWPLNRTSES